MTVRAQNKPFDPPSPPNEDGASGWRWRQDLTRNLRTFAAAVANGDYGARIALRRRALFPRAQNPGGDGLIYVDESGALLVQLGGAWLALAAADRPPVGYERLIATAATSPVGPDITTGWTDVDWLDTLGAATPGISIDTGTSKITLTRAGVYTAQVEAVIDMSTAPSERLISFRLRDTVGGVTMGEALTLIPRTATLALLQGAEVFTVTEAQAAAAAPLTLQVGGTDAVGGVTWTSTRLDIRSIGPV